MFNDISKKRLIESGVEASRESDKKTGQSCCLSGSQNMTGHSDKREEVLRNVVKTYLRISNKSHRMG